MKINLDKNKDINFLKIELIIKNEEELINFLKLPI